MADTPASPERSKFERTIFWIGSLSGIVISLFTIWEKVTQPSPPELVVDFFESASREIAIHPPINTALDKSRPIPLQLRVINRGGKVAKNVKLYLSHSTSTILIAQYKKEEKRTWNSPNESMKQVSLSLDDMNPGETFLIPIIVELHFPRDVQSAIAHPNLTSDKRLLVPQAHLLYADVSSDSSPNQRSALSIVLGSIPALQQQFKEIYWVGYGEGGPKVLKAKDDYLSR